MTLFFQIASTTNVQPADRLKLYLALLGLGVLALFALIILTVVRRGARLAASQGHTHTKKRLSPWQTAGQRARPEAGDSFLPVFGMDAGTGRKNTRPTDSPSENDPHSKGGKGAHPTDNPSFGDRPPHDHGPDHDFDAGGDSGGGDGGSGGGDAGGGGGGGGGGDGGGGGGGD